MNNPTNDAVLAAPPIGVGALTLWGVPLSEWVLICTLFYTILLIIDKLPSAVARVVGWVRKLKDKNVSN
jgi:hypothetical protein